MVVDSVWWMIIIVWGCTLEISGFLGCRVYGVCIVYDAVIVGNV